jgi:hypothetical protein
MAKAERGYDRYRVFAGIDADFKQAAGEMQRLPRSDGQGSLASNPRSNSTS